MRIRAKICGITREEDAHIIAVNGADALGLVFYPPSPRHVDIEQAEQIVAKLPPFVSKVALFVNADREYIDEVCRRVSIDLIQFHGNECVDYCESFNRPYIKAIAMKPNVDLAAERKRYASASALLVDTYKPGIPGGTGEVFEWDRIPAHLANDIILAGGLDASNVKRAIQQVKPWAVDVSGGVEATKGIKDAAKVAAFMKQVNSCE